MGGVRLAAGESCLSQSEDTAMGTLQDKVALVTGMAPKPFSPNARHSAIRIPHFPSANDSID